MIRPLSLTRPWSRSSRVIRSGAVRLTAITEPQRSSSMLASFLSRVMPALCTTTSTPPNFSFTYWAIRCGASLLVMSRVRLSPPSSRVTSSSSLAAWGTSMPRIVAPSRWSTRAICSPMPREAPVTSATLPVSGLSMLGTGSASVVPVAPIRTTWPETYARLGGQEEGERRVDRHLGALGDVHELDGAAAADLLAERAGEALQGALRDPLRAGQQLRHGAEHDDPAAREQAAHQRLEELLQGDQPGGVRGCRWRRTPGPCTSRPRRRWWCSRRRGRPARP